MNMISGIILAAGESKRMGELKQLLPFGKSTVIETALDALIASKLDEIIVVLGYESERIKEKIAAKLDYKRVRAAYNPDYKLGMFTSIKAGIKAVAPNSNALLIALVDQPFIKSELVNEVIGAFSKTDKGIVIPSYNMRRGHPMLIDLRKYIAEIMNTPGEESGLRDLIRAHSDDIFYLVVDSDIVLRDMDYKEDYVRELNELSAISRQPKDSN
jgi:molybdenum cofactor cytidylyltransferase